MLVLHVVGSGQVHDVRSACLHQLHARGKHELRQLGAVDARHGHADQLQYAADAVFGELGMIGLLCGEADAAQLVAEELAQLVFGRNHRHLAARVGQHRQQGRGAQPLRVIHHDLNAALGVVEVVAADPVNRWWRASDNRQIVRVGEARHDAVGDHRGALHQHPLHPRHVAAGHRLGDVVRLAAIHAHHHRGLLRQPICASIYFDPMHVNTPFPLHPAARISASTLPIASTAPAVPRSPSWPMQPTRNVSSVVSLPGYRM